MVPTKRAAASSIRIGRIGLQSHNEAISAPEFYAQAAYQPPGLYDRLGVIRARQTLEPHKMAVASDEIHPIFSHP